MNYKIEEQTIDTVDLKTLLITKGIKVSGKIYSKFKNDFRLSNNPKECNTIILPDNTIVQLTDLAFHMNHIKSTILLYWPWMFPPCMQ